jgi:hypothetical protein
MHDGQNGVSGMTLHGITWGQTNYHYMGTDKL